MPTLGSSPLTRGKRAPAASAEIDPRLIPAHAGKTNRQQCSALAWGAHPRSRGENSLLRSLLPSPLGSSPLTRGKRDAGFAKSSGIGLIPAHAGKTSRRAGRMDQRRAHPRSRGENVEPGDDHRATNGSSPLTRGKPTGSGRPSSSPGLIPAHAGKTPAARPPRRTPRAHPRSRGENGWSDQS